LNESSQASAAIKDSGYSGLINTLSKINPEKIIVQSEELSGESPLAARFCSIIDELRLIDS
jgi:hypothetical protein